MSSPCDICNILNRIIEAFKAVKKVRFTGDVNFRVNFYEGSARGIKATKERQFEI